MRICQCFSCKLGRRSNRTMKNGSHRQKNDLIKQLLNYYFMEGEDNDYHKAILDGSWPSSVKILEALLEKAKNRKESE